MYSEKMIKSLEISKKIVDNLSFAELDAMMAEFDDFVVETNCDWFYNNVTFSDFLHESYKNFELFKLFDKQRRKSVNIEKNNEENLNKVLFSFIYL